MTEDMRILTDNYKNEQNIFSLFVDECCVKICFYCFEIYIFIQKLSQKINFFYTFMCLNFIRVYLGVKKVQKGVKKFFKV